MQSSFQVIRDLHYPGQRPVQKLEHAALSIISCKAYRFAHSFAAAAA